MTYLNNMYAQMLSNHSSWKQKESSQFIYNWDVLDLDKFIGRSSMVEMKKVCQKRTDPMEAKCHSSVNTLRYKKTQNLECHQVNDCLGITQKTALIIQPHTIRPIFHSLCSIRLHKIYVHYAQSLHKHTCNWRLAILLLYAKKRGKSVKSCVETRTSSRYGKWTLFKFRPCQACMHSKTPIPSVTY